MKHALKTLLFILLGINILTFITSCQKEDGTSDIGGSSDNTGVELRMRNSSNGGDYILLLKVENAYYNDLNYVGFGINGSNNFYVWDRYGVADMVCVGNVNGLSKIKNIPESGWADQVAVQPGSGYIIRSKNLNIQGSSQWCRYARVYVEEWIEGTSGGILGAVIRYQDNWKIVE